MKTDPRVRYTQSVIQTAFLDLLQEKPVSKITVREVCEKAQINRSTFYRYYMDCYDLLDKLKEDALSQFETVLDSIDTHGTRQAILAVLNALKHSSSLYAHLSRAAGDQTFTHELVRRCFRFMKLHIPDAPEGRWSGEKQGMGYSFLTAGSAGVMEYWLHENCRIPEEEVADTLLALTSALTRPDPPASSSPG